MFYLVTSLKMRAQPFAPQIPVSIRFSKFSLENTANRPSGLTARLRTPGAGEGPNDGASRVLLSFESRRCVSVWPPFFPLNDVSTSLLPAAEARGRTPLSPARPRLRRLAVSQSSRGRAGRGAGTSWRRRADVRRTRTRRETASVTERRAGRC